MKLLFWFSLFLTVYAYVGYAIWLSLYARLRRRPICRSHITPNVSIVIAARNEELNLPAKLDNLRQLKYPRKHLQIVIASDGSTDSTAKILEDNRPEICSVILDQSRGKASALNAAVKQATGDILVFLDMRQTVEPDAVIELVSCLADPSVGAVSGELLLESGSGGDGLGIYWKIEKIVRKLESNSGSVVGVTGCIYAMRREFYSEIPAGTLLDDVYVPMQVVHLGKRVVFEPRAIARDRIFGAKGKEFARKVRTLTGNYQLLKLQPWLLSFRNPLLFRFVSHKLMRLFVPIFLVALFLSSALCPGAIYHVFFYLQIVFYTLALIGSFSPALRSLKPVAIASTFTMLNAAAAVAFYNFVTGRDAVWG